MRQTRYKSMPFYAESDGDPGRMAHYVCDERDPNWRSECVTAKLAKGYATELNIATRRHWLNMLQRDVENLGYSLREMLDGDICVEDAPDLLAAVTAFLKNFVEQTK